MIWYRRKKDAPKRFDGGILPDEWTPVGDDPSPRMQRELIEGRYCDFEDREQPAEHHPRASRRKR